MELVALWDSEKIKEEELKEGVKKKRGRVVAAAAAVVGYLVKWKSITSTAAVSHLNWFRHGVSASAHTRRSPKVSRARGVTHHTRRPGLLLLVVVVVVPTCGSPQQQIIRINIITSRGSRHSSVFLSTSHAP